MKEIMKEQLRAVKIEKMIASGAMLMGMICLVLVFWNPLLGLVAWALTSLGDKLYKEAKVDETRIVIDQLDDDNEDTVQ